MNPLAPEQKYALIILVCLYAVFLVALYQRPMPTPRIVYVTRVVKDVPPDPEKVASE